MLLPLSLGMLAGLLDQFRAGGLCQGNPEEAVLQH
jgi:hypothetical protein